MTGKQVDSVGADAVWREEHAKGALGGDFIREVQRVGEVPNGVTTRWLSETQYNFYTD